MSKLNKNQAGQPAESSQMKRMIRHLKVGTFIVLMSLLLGLPVALISHQQNVDQVLLATELSPSEQLSIRQALEGLDTKNFWHTDVKLIQAKVERLSWVKDAEVRKTWPNLLVVGLTPQTPVAHWNDGHFLNQLGQLVETFRTPIELPHISSPDAFRQLAIKRLNAIQTQLTTVDQITIDTRGAAVAKLSSGVQIHFGTTDFQARLRRVRRALLEKQKGNRQVASIDTRYSGGLAVSWRQPQHLTALQ